MWILRGVLGPNVSPIFPLYIMSNETYRRMTKNYDTLPLRIKCDILWTTCVRQILWTNRLGQILLKIVLVKYCEILCGTIVVGENVWDKCCEKIVWDKYCGKFVWDKGELRRHVICHTSTALLCSPRYNSSPLLPPIVMLLVPVDLSSSQFHIAF